MSSQPYGLSPKAVASARNALARARAIAPVDGCLPITSNARQDESDQAMADAVPQRGQRIAVAERCSGARAQQAGQTP